MGNQERTAALNLRRVGLEAGTTAYLPWPKAPLGTVLAQDPPPKAQGIERPGINLLVAAADDATVDGYVMPDLTGLPIVSAQAALSRVGIKFSDPKFVETGIKPIGGAVSSAPIASVGSAASAPPASPQAQARPTALPGVVVSQSPPAGWRVDVGSTVTLSVAK